MSRSKDDFRAVGDALSKEAAERENALQQRLDLPRRDLVVTQQRAKETRVADQLQAEKDKEEVIRVAAELNGAPE